MAYTPYSAGTNLEGDDVVLGPGNGLGYYSKTLYPGLVCASKEESERAAKIANIAFHEGYLKAKEEIRKALGLSG